VNYAAVAKDNSLRETITPKHSGGGRVGLVPDAFLAALPRMGCAYRFQIRGGAAVRYSIDRRLLAPLCPGVGTTQVLGFALRFSELD
jgi:hypothetical protein